MVPISRLDSWAAPRFRSLIGADAAEVLAADLGRFLRSEGSVLVLDDENTHAAAGAAVLLPAKGRVLELAALIDWPGELPERLVLDDPRAVAIARVYLREIGERAEEVPAAGEESRAISVRRRP